MMTRRTLLISAALAPALARVARAASRLSVFELRSYATQPGRRDELITMFEEHFLDAYERAGALILGTFRHLDDPDRWVWIRAFGDLQTREAALQGFYTAETWLSRADACNATIADVSDARLLGWASGEVLASPPPRPPAGAAGVETSVFEVSIHDLPPGRADQFMAFHGGEIAPLLETFGGAAVGALVTRPGMKTDPKRPVRGGTCFVALRRFDNKQAQRAAADARAASREWRALEAETSRRLEGPVETCRLQPTPRSALR